MSQSICINYRELMKNEKDGWQDAPNGLASLDEFLWDINAKQPRKVTVHSVNRGSDITDAIDWAIQLSKKWPDISVQVSVPSLAIYKYLKVHQKLETLKPRISIRTRCASKKFFYFG